MRSLSQIIVNVLVAHLFVYPLCVQISTNVPPIMAAAMKMQFASTQSAATTATVNSGTTEVLYISVEVKE